MEALNITDLASDHNPISVRMSETFIKERVPPKTVRNYKDYSEERLVSSLALVNWSAVYEASDIIVATTVFTSKLDEVLSTLCPFSRITLNNHHRKFISARTRSIMVARYKNFNDWKRTGEQLYHVEYKKL